MFHGRRPNASALVTPAAPHGEHDPALGLVDYEPYALQPFDLDVPAYP
jgi:hypothetical protein